MVRTVASVIVEGGVDLPVTDSCFFVVVFGCIHQGSGSQQLFPLEPDTVFTLDWALYIWLCGCNTRYPAQRQAELWITLHHCQLLAMMQHSRGSCRGML